MVPLNTTCTLVPTVEVAKTPMSLPPETALKQLPLKSLKHPPESAMPFAKVDVAEVEVILIFVAETPAENVEVAAAVEVMVPSLAMLKRLEVTPAAVVEPIVKRFTLVIVEVASMEKRDAGVLDPIPTLPSFFTTNSVEVAVPPVVEAISKSVVGAPVPLVEVAVIARSA